MIFVHGWPSVDGEVHGRQRVWDNKISVHTPNIVCQNIGGLVWVSEVHGRQRVLDNGTVIYICIHIGHNFSLNVLLSPSSFYLHIFTNTKHCVSEHGWPSVGE